MGTVIKVVIDERAFRDLVAGKVVSFPRAANQIILGDIAWTHQLAALLDALAGQVPQADPPEAREFLPRRNQRR